MTTTTRMMAFVFLALANTLLLTSCVQKPLSISYPKPAENIAYISGKIVKERSFWSRGELFLPVTVDGDPVPGGTQFKPVSPGKRAIGAIYINGMLGADLNLTLEAKPNHVYVLEGAVTENADNQKSLSYWIEDEGNNRVTEVKNKTLTVTSGNKY